MPKWCRRLSILKKKSIFKNEFYFNCQKKFIYLHFFRMSKTHRILTPRLIFSITAGAPMICIGFIALSEALSLSRANYFLHWIFLDVTLWTSLFENALLPENIQDWSPITLLVLTIILLFPVLTLDQYSSFLKPFASLVPVVKYFSTRQLTLCVQYAMFQGLKRLSNRDILKEIISKKANVRLNYDRR